uniref:Flavodoxin n=1 Tax=Desulfobacca acetoxidans TaxID=60893 RepID=A0A7V6A296_9BACT
MKILNLYFSSTGNTEKVALRISATAAKMGHQVDTIKIAGEPDREVDLLEYDVVFIGSGVYQWLPGKALQEFIEAKLSQYAAAKEIKLSAPRRPQKKGVVYCTYGGAHTGANEALPAVKYMGQLLDHLGIEVVAEWYVIGAYPDKGRFAGLSAGGRLGNIEGRPNEADLADVAERVTGVLRM